MCHWTGVLLDHRGASTLRQTAAPLAGVSKVRDAEVSLDLNLSRVTVEVDGEGFFHDGQRFLLDGIGEVLREPRKVFRPVQPAPGDAVRTWEPVRVYTDRYYQLVPTAEAPTIEIDGIQMHRTRGVHPFESSGAFAAAVVRAGARVLDTCGGLGYTAIHALRLGAVEVRSFEISEGVLLLRRVNPWSQLEAGRESLRLEETDVFKASARLDRASFDAIIHDPPRYALAPDLYSTAFYLRLGTLLTPRGVLFHYTGDPNSRRRGSTMVQGVIERLRAAGFRTDARPELQGLVARPRARRGLSPHKEHTP